MLRLGSVRPGRFGGGARAAPAAAALRHASPLLLARPAAAAGDRQLATRAAAAAPLSMELIKSAAAEIDAALRKGNLEQMKARSASLFLEQYNSRATSFTDAATLLQKEPEFIGVLLQTCVETGRLATARSLFASVEATPDFSPDAAAYSAMILGYCDQRVPDRAVPVLRAAMAAGVELEDSTWVHSQLIHTLGTCGRLRDAEALLPDLTAIYGSREPPSPLPRVLYRRLVQACSQSGELEKALGYADEMELSKHTSNLLFTADFWGNACGYSVRPREVRCAAAGDTCRLPDLRLLYVTQPADRVSAPRVAGRGGPFSGGWR